jgi:hypothetical protein
MTAVHITRRLISSLQSQCDVGWVMQSPERVFAYRYYRPSVNCTRYVVLSKFNPRTRWSGELEKKLLADQTGLYGNISADPAVEEMAATGCGWGRAPLIISHSMMAPSPRRAGEATRVTRSTEFGARRPVKAMVT